MSTKNQKEISNFQIPEGGTLGILAYGYRGIMLWRLERKRLHQEKIKDKPSTTKNVANE